MSLKSRFFIYNVFMVLGAICAAADILSDFAKGIYEFNMTPMVYLAIAFFAVGLVLRFTFVKCPHCGDKLIGHKKVPAQCPVCGTMSDKKL